MSPNAEQERLDFVDLFGRLILDHGYIRAVALVLSWLSAEADDAAYAVELSQPPT